MSLTDQFQCLEENTDKRKMFSFPTEKNPQMLLIYFSLSNNYKVDKLNSIH